MRSKQFEKFMPAILLFCFFFHSIVRADVVDRIAVIVNDEIITQSDIKKYTDRVRKGGLVDDTLVPDEETKKEILAEPAKLVQKMIYEKILDSEVRRQNLSVPFERVEQELRAIANRNNISRDDLKTAITEKGIAFSQYQDFIKTGLERQSLIAKQVTAKIKVSEDDVLAQLASGPDGQRAQIFEYTLAHIQFVPEKSGAPATQRANLVLEKLREGGDFDKLASEYSEDPNFTAGGILGTFRTGEIIKEMEIPVSKLSVGEYTPIIATKSGLHIVKLLKKVPVSDPVIEKEKERIRASLYDKAVKRQFQSWIEQMRSEAFIRINDHQYDRALAK